MRNFHWIILLIISTVLLLISVEVNIFHPNWFSEGFGFGCIVSFLYFIHFFPEAIASTRWPTVEGEIIKSEVGKRQVKREPGIFPVVVYSYHVNEQDYQAKRIKVGTQTFSSTSYDWVQGTLDKYPLGKKVTIHYNPNSPTKAVLEPGFTWRIIGFGIAALVFYAIAWGFGLVFSAI